MRIRVFIAAVLCIVACGDTSEDDSTTTTTVPTGAVTGAVTGTITGVATGSATGAPSCAWEGDWEVTAALCAGIDQTDAFGEVFNRVAMTVDAECGASVLMENQTCKETEDFLFAIGPTYVDVTPLGITACNPDDCGFFPYDAPCALDDRAGGMASLVLSESPDGNDLSITGMLQESYPNCIADLTLVWTRGL
jgi:hypothetical protein